MPIYTVNNKTFNIPDDKVDAFEKKYPHAYIEYHTEDKKYNIPLSAREGFLKKYPNATYSKQDGPSSPSVSVEPAQVANPVSQVKQDSLSVDADEDTDVKVQSSQRTMKPETTDDLIARIQRNGKKDKQEELLEALSQRQEQKTAQDRYVKGIEDSIEKKANELIEKDVSLSTFNKTKDNGLQFNPSTGKLERSYSTPYGNTTTDRHLADMESSQYASNMTVSGQLRQAQRKLDELKRMKQERANEVHDETADFIDSKLTGFGQALIGGNFYVSKQMSDPEKNTLDAAILETEEQIKILEREIDRQNNKRVGFWRGFTDITGDINTWDFGLGDAKHALTLLDVGKDYPHKSDGTKQAEQELLESVYKKQQAQQSYGRNDNFWFRAGTMTGHMPAFMIDFAVTGGGFDGINALSKAATKGATKAIGKEVIEEMAKQGFKNYVKANGVKGFSQYAGNWTIKALGTMADDLIIRAPLMTNTVQAAKTASDIIDRKLGSVVVNEDGTYDFSNDKTWSNAIWQGEANAIIENYSEMFGAHLAPVTLKNMSDVAAVFGAKRLSGVLAKADASAIGAIMGKTNEMFTKLGVSDYFGEVTEEYYGQLWRTMLNLDDAYRQNPDGSRTNLLATGQFHGDILGGMALSMGLMGAGKYSLSAANYTMMKHDVNKADSRARELFGNDIWEPLRQTIDLTTNDDIGNYIGSVLIDDKLTLEEKEAVLNYVERSLYLRGFNLATLAQSRNTDESDSDIIDQQNNESFLDGYNASTPQEMNDAKNMLEIKKAEMIHTFGFTDESDIEAFLGENPIETVAQRRQNGESQESTQTVIDYLNAKATYVGMIQRVCDDIDGQIEQSNALIDSHTNKHTGKIHGAVSKEDGRLVYIVSGNVVPYQDGSGIDLQNSDENIIVRDAETGELKQMSPEFLSSLYDTQYPNEQKEINAQQIREKILSEESNKIDGVVDFNDKEQLLNEIANQIAITMILAQRGLDADYIKTFIGNAQIVENPDGTLTFTDGQNEVVVPKQEIQQQVDANNMQRAVDFNDKAKEMRNAIQQAAATTTLSYGMGDNISLRDADGNIINGTISMIEDDTYVIDYSDNNGTWHTLDLTQQELDNMIVGHNGSTLNQPVSEQKQADWNSDEQYQYDDEMSFYNGQIHGTLNRVENGTAIYVDDKGEPVILLAAKNDHQFIGIFREPNSNKWSIKMENKQGDKGAFKGLLSSAMSKLPIGAEIYERTSISLDGLRIFSQQLEHGFEIGNDTYETDVNGADMANVFGLSEADQESMASVHISENELPKVKEILRPYLEKFGVKNIDNVVYLTNGNTLSIKLPILVKTGIGTSVPKNNIDNTSSTEETHSTNDNGVQEWYKNIHLSGELDQNNVPFVLSPDGNVDFGYIESMHNLPEAPIRLSMGDISNGYIHINKRHGNEIKKAGFNSIEEFIKYVADNFTRIQEGSAYDNSNNDKNQSYLIQLQDGHNNTLFVQLSRDGKYWNVNSAGVFGKSYGNKKKNIWSASEVQSDNSAVVSDGSQSEPIAENGSTSNGTPSKSSEHKDNNSFDNNNELEEKVYQASENLRKYVEFFNYRYGYEFTSERDFYNWIVRKYKTKKDIYLWLSDNLPKENVSYAMRAIIDYGIASKQLIEQSSTNKGDLTLQSTTDETVPTSQSSLIPKDESGNPIYEQADSETAWDALMEDAEGDEIMAGEVAKSMIADKEAELKKLEKTKIKEGKTPAEKMAALKERKAEVEKIKQDIEAWKKIAAVPIQRQIAQQERIRQEEAEAAAKRKADEESLLAERLEALRNKQELHNGIPDYSEDTPQNARARGYRRVNGHIEERQQAIEAVQGKETEVEFSNDVRPKGHYAVIDASQLQPSHIQGNRNPLHFLDEAQPKERNDKASIVSAQKIAGNIRPATITTGETAYVGTPTVNTRGEVIQGNSRSDALKLMYGNHNDQAQTYKQYLMDNAEQFGLNPEDVSNMESPVLVRMLDVNDEQAITLGQYVAQDTESGGIERIKPKNAVKKMGEDIGSFANILLKSNDEDVSFAELLDQNGVEVLKWMAQKSYITPTQYNSAFDTKGSLTAEAKNDLRGIMYQSIFEGGNTRLEEMFNALPAKAQKAILATAHRDFNSPNSERMIEEIQDSIRAFYALMQDEQFAKAKNLKDATKAVEAWQKQYQMDDVTGEGYLPSEKFSNFALHLAKLYKGEKQSNIQGVFAELYDLIQGTKEDNLFEQAYKTPRTLVQAIKEVLNIDYNGQRRNNVLGGDNKTSQQGQHGRTGDVASRERTESGEQSSNDSGRTDEDSGSSAFETNRQTENESGDIRTAQTVHQSGSEREGFEQTLDGRRQTDSSGMADDNATVLEKRTSRSDIRVLEEGLDAKRGDNTEHSERTRRTAESERLVNTAKQHGLFIPAEVIMTLTGKYPKRTGESVVYIDAEAGKVTKVKDPYAKSAMKSGVQPEDAIFEHRVHNLLFPETAYTLEGISEELGDVRIVLTQDYIQTKGHPTKEQITEALAKRGLFPEDKYSFGNEFVSVTDVEGDNVLLGEDGTVYFIDPIIRFKKPLKEILDNYNRNNNSTLGEQIKSAEKEVNTSPTDKQKEAGNYKKGHVQIGTFNITIEQPKGSVRSGVDANGRKWETTMHNTYGYIRGTEGVDGDHIDVFLSDDIDGWNGNNVFVVDQYNEDGTFDEHKVMLGFNTIEEAESAYLDNYEKGWEKKHKIVVSPIHTENFEKWIESSHRKTKPFAEYKSVKSEENRTKNNENRTKSTENSSKVEESSASNDTSYTIEPAQYTTKKGKVLDMHLVKFDKPLSKEQQQAAKELARAEKGWYDAKQGGFMMRSNESAKTLANTILNDENAVADAQPVSMNDIQSVNDGNVLFSEPQQTEQPKAPKSKKVHTPIWQYIIHVDDDGYTMLSREDISGEIPILDDWGYSSESPEEMLEILRNPQNNMQEVLNAVEVTLENKIKTRDFDRKIREEREQKRIELRTNGVNGYKIGDRVIYTPVSGTRKPVEATIHDFEEYGDNKPVLDTGLAPVMYEVVEWENIKKTENSSVERPQKGDVYKNNIAGGDAVALIQSVGKKGYVLAFASNLEDAQGGLFMGDKIVDFKEMDRWLTDGSLTKIEQQQSTNPSGNRLVTDERYEELKQRMRRKLGGQMNIGIDPEILAIGTEMAVYHLEKGARKFAEYAKSMIADLGDVIRPYLKAFYNGARDLPEIESSDIAKDMTSYDEVQTFDVANFDKSSVNAIATAETVIREEEVEKEVKIAKDRIKKNRNNHNNKKKSVNSQGQTGSLFDDLFNNENSNDNGLQRNDEVRSEGLSADNNINTGTGSKTGNSQEVQQESGRTDGNRDGGSQRTGREIQNGNVRSSGRIQGLTEKKNTRNNRSERGQNHAPTSVDARIEANIKAIELAKRLLENGEQATKEQMEVLRKFSGWGGLGKAFNERASYVHEGRHYYNEPTVENKKIRELLGEEAYQQAENSKYSSFYTPAYIVDTLWDIAEQMGFKGGNILEGSAGIGNILGQMPAHISENSDIHAIEIDNTSGGILSLLYPDAKVEVQGFEETHITNGSVDLAITNVPFITDWHVKDTSGDKDLSRKFHNIHDFCIAKNVRKLREGGIGIFITSNGTLDSSKKLRDWIVSEGNSDFVGAFRMHNKTFGGTSVTSDIIVIRKRVNGQKSVNAIDVSTVSGERTTNFDTGETRKVKGVETSVTKQLSMDYNRYFIEHPERMAGEMHFAFEKGDTYRPTSKGLYPSQDKNQEQMLTEFVKSFKEEEVGNKASNDVEVTDAIPGKKIGEMFVKDGKLYINAIGSAQPLDVNANKVKGHTKAECFKAYSSIKDALKEVLDYQSNHESDNGLKPLLEKLNKAYNDFVSTYGHFNKNTSIAFLRNDVDYANVASVETYKETGDGKGGIKQTFGKADVLTKRVIEKEKEPTPTNVKDGIVASMFKHGRIDIQYIAEQLGKSEADVKKEIISKGYGFEDPITRQIEVSYQYLSGNVREKLLQAQENNENGEFNSNIKALQEILPMNIPAHLIDFTLGSSWIDSQLYDDYVKDRTDVEVKFTAVGGTWFMKEPYYTGYEKNRSMGVTSEMLGKTIMGHTLIEAAIQNKSITVSTTRKNWDGSTETIVDKEATQACASKIDEIRQDFKGWARQKMQSDPELSAKMERIYNDTFNNYVPVKVTDEFLPKYFAGAIHKYEMRPHQKRAIVRGTMQPLMLAHEVGSGKTFTLISTAMEMRRLGTARKPMIVVQNATVGQFVASAKELYPNAKILTLEDGDRNAEGRKNFYAKIKYNDWDMIVVPQSTFEFIPDSEEREMAFIQDKIEEKMLILEQMKNADPDGNSMITRQAEREIAMLEEELAGLSEMSSKKRTANDEKKRAVALQNAEVKAMEMLDRRTDDVENFDDMGIDALLVDEAHEYKHLGFATAMQRGVKGVDPSYSKKSQGVFLKTQAVLEKNNGRNVIFATGTPISNTAAEIWTFMRYLMPADTMKEYGIYYFDDFVRNFGNIQQMLEFTTSGKFKENNRFAGYVNLPELVRIWSGVSDTVNFEDIEDDLKKQGKDDLRPEIENGKAQDIYLPQTRALRGIMKFVKAQLDAFDQMSGKMKKENSHIPLTMYGIAKAAAVDARLVQSDAEDDPNSKTNEAVRQTLRSLKETESYKGTIAIFADNYQNKESGFNLYEDIRSKLIAEGVSSNEIAVIKSGMTVKKKLEIFEKVNRGEIRVILGSTFTLGTGVNIQERLHTLIHLDAPNRPMDYTQRNGRIQRQGNIHKEMGIPVRILRFGVEDSLDVTAYQRLKTKGAIADSIMKGKQMMSDSMTNRVLEEEEDVFGDTVAQLSGSEYAMLKNNAEKNVRKYQSRKKQWEADQTYIHNAKPRIKGLIKDAETRIELNSRNLKEVQSAFPDGKFKEITIGKKRFTSIESMEDFFKEHNKSVIADTKKIKDGEMSGNQTREVTIQIDGYSFIVKTELTKEFSSKGINMFSEVHRKMTYSCPQLGIENVPVKQALLRNGVEDIVNNIITGKDFAELLEASEHSKKHNETELEQLMSREGKPFEYEKELEQAQKQLVEYSELMKKEMAEKEAKYAEMDASVEAASDIANAEEDDVLYREDEYKTEKIFGGIWIEDKQEFAKFVSAVNNNYVFEEDGEGITYTDNHFYAYYWNIDGEPTPYIDVYLNAKESQDVVNEVSKEINHVRRGKGIKKYIDRAITRAGSSNGKNNGNHGNNTSIPHRAGNDKLGGNILRKGRYFDNPSLYVKTQRADRYNRDRVNTVSSSPAPAQRRQMVEHAENLAKRLHLDNIEIVNSVSGLEGNKKSAKGFYDPKTGKITIVIPNNTSIADIEKTLLHEAVAHYGLRQLFGEHFDTFLDNVYNNVDENIRKRIAELAIRKYNYDFRKATEEYLASLAESTNFENAQQSSWWQKVKDFFADMLSKLGFKDFRGVTLTDNELRYILWRSYENLSSKRHKGVFGQAADIAKQYELGVGDYAKSSESEDDVLFRDGDPEIHEKVLVRDKYDRRIKAGWYQSKEAFQDSMLSLKEAMKDIAGMEIEDIDGFENAYLGENRLSSVNKAEADAFARLLFKPMLDEVAKLAPTAAERQELVDYMMAKHGLERNEYMRQQAMQNGEDANRDFAGLTSLTGFDDITAAEAEAQIMVNEYEQNHDTTELWDNVNAVSKAILSKSYECGLIDKDTFENISNMYEFYIPLRGFEEKTSDEAYAYLSHIHSAFNAPIKKSRGRKSKADDPFAYLQSMAESAIMQGNRNKLVKQRFLNFVLNHPSDLVSVSELWLEYDNVDDEWRPVFPDNIDTNDSGEVVEQKMKDFDEKMKLLAQNEPDRYKKGRDAIGIPYRVVKKKDLQQHQVIVKRNGRDVVLTVNGNPRLAQALNGQTNPDNDMSGAIGAVLRSGEWVNRQLSAFYTTRNPDFIVSNFLRDMLYSNSMAWFKESPNYALRFNRNYMIANPITMKRLLNKYRKGTLDTSDKIEGMFYQFMMNGGETGYANIRDIEQHKNDIRKELRRSNGRLKIGRALSLLAERFDELNRAIENCARFAAFMTSKEIGRTTDRAIYDAKEISVNFNKKGSGSKFYGEVGQTVAGNASALVSGLGRGGFVFWNAAIQGTTNFGRQIKRHPAKAFTGIASMFLLGALVAFLGGDDDDDDNKNSYYNLPEYVRRSNILFRAGEHWISIPLPVEYRAIYGLGELMTSTISGKEHLTDSEIAEAIIGQMSQVLPLDFMEGGGGLNALVPSAVKPVIEAYVAEKSWTGMPLYKDTPYNKNMPEWTKAYSSANKHIVNLTASLNEATGGDRYTKGWLDQHPLGIDLINPAKIEYVLKGYFGGVFNTIDKMAKMAETAAGEREYDPQNFLLLNRVVKAGDERTEYRAVNNEYQRLKKEYEILDQRLKNYERDTYKGIFDYAEKIDFIYNSPEFQRHEIFEIYKKDIKFAEEWVKQASSVHDDEGVKEAEHYLNEIKKEMIEEMNKTRKRA